MTGGTTAERRRTPAVLVVLAVVILIASGVSPHDRLTWVLEVFPILIGIPILVAAYRQFSFTTLLYLLLFVHAVILMVGGHYTYAKVTAGFWLKDIFDFERNHYDRR